MWAGFVALADQLSQQNNRGLLGFLNPVLYGIGKTRGQPAPTDLYSTGFHDIADGVNAGPGGVGGFVSVAGYDLNTGWGTPTCQLLQQVGSTTPTSPLGYSELQLHINNGDDGIDDTSTALLSVFTTSSNGNPAFPPIVIHPEGTTGWSPHGVVTDTTWSLNLPLQPTDITSISLTLMSQTGTFCNANDQIACDNWSVAGLDVRLYDPASMTAACVIHQDGVEGSVARLTFSNPTMSFAPGGCSEAAPTPPPDPISELTFIFGTGDDCAAVPPQCGSGALPAGTELDISIFPQSAGAVPCTCPPATGAPAPLETGVLLPTGGGGFSTDSQNTVVFQLQEGPTDLSQLGTICVTPHDCQSTNGWLPFGLNVLADQPGGPVTCLWDQQGTPLSGEQEQVNAALRTGCP
jgi:hypothetical protein